MKWMVLFSMLASAVHAQVEGPWKLYYDSTQFYWAKDWNKTVALLENAERSALTDLGIYHENYLTIINDLGTAYWKAKNYPKAEQVLSRTLALKKEVYTVNDKEVVLSISNLAGFYAEQGLWAKSKSLYNRILQAGRAEVPDDVFVNAAESLVSLYDLDQQPDSANLLLSEIEKWNLIPVNSYLAFQHQFYRARIHRKLSEYAAAESELARLAQALEGRPETEFKELHIQCLQEQGILLLETGNYSQAEKKLLQAYEMASATMTRDDLTTELANHLAQVYDNLNISDKALHYYEESLSRCRASYAPNSLPCVILVNNIAGIHLKEENLSSAIGGYQKVIHEFKNLLPASDPLYITALNNLATAYRKNNELNLAKEYLAQAYTLLKNNGHEKSDLAATVLNNLAVINTSEGKYAEAAIHYEQAYDIKRSLYGDKSVLLTDLIGNLAVTYWALDKPQHAIPLFKKSMALAARQVSYVFPNLNENEQVQFYEKLKEDFERFNTIAMQWAHHDDELVSRMLENQMVIKSLQFFTRQRRNHQVSRKMDPQLNELIARMKVRRNRLGHLYQVPLADLEDAAAITALEKEIDSLEKSISRRTSEMFHGNDLNADEFRWKSLSRKLKADEAIIEMVRFRKYDRRSSANNNRFGFTESVYYAALIVTRETTGAPELVLLKHGNDLETRYFNFYKNTLKYGVDDRLSYKFFWRPLEEHLSGKRKIFFSADGVYHRINVNTLRDREAGKFLLEKFDIVYLLNAAQLLESNAAVTTSRRDPVLMGDPAFDLNIPGIPQRVVTHQGFARLPGTAGELLAIDKVLKGRAWKTNIFMQNSATEANLKTISSPSILHIATHGFFSSDVVSLNTNAKKEFLFHSGIVLSGANASLSAASTDFENDGILTAYEVMSLDLTGTELVVLSACETGLGKVENGEGVFGLQRSFMLAGARNVLISLWKVDDEATRDLMIAFYEQLAKGKTLHDSLKEAQMAAITRSSNPAVWGAFMLVGNN